MLSMGNGYLSFGRIYELIKDIMHCFETLSALQQGTTEAEDDYEEESKMVLRKLANDMGYRITIEKAENCEKIK